MPNFSFFFPIFEILSYVQVHFIFGHYLMPATILFSGNFESYFN